MFENVLIGVDGSTNSRDAIALAKKLASGDAKLTLAHVHAGVLNPMHATTPGMLEEERAASHALLERERAEAEIDAGLVSVVSTMPGRGLHDVAEDERADLLVVGSTSRGPFRRAMLGDDTRASLNGAPCAVAIAARGYASQPTWKGVIGLGYDGSPESEAALAAARALAERTGSSLRALQVVSLPNYAFGPVALVSAEGIDALIAEAAERLAQLDGVEGRAVYGLVGEELAAFSDELDLLVVGSRNYGPAKRLVLGSTSHYLQRHARCSLLVLPRGARS